MKTMTFGNYLKGKAIPVETRLLSIFDRNLAGQIGEDGLYYVIYENVNTHNPYAVVRENYYKWLDDMESKGARILHEGETAIIDGIEVRGMTFAEEMSWNEDRLMANVDHWGNIEVHDTFDYEWYYDNCI